MSGDCFIDTNLFIYQLEASDERKAATADRIISEASSPQRLHQLPGRAGMPEYRASQGRNSTQHRRDETIPGQRPGTFVPGSASLSLYRRALELQARYRYGFYDSLIMRPLSTQVAPDYTARICRMGSGSRSHHREPVCWIVKLEL